MGWSETFLQTLKNNDVRFITYVPDNVLTPLVKGVAFDDGGPVLMAVKINDKPGATQPRDPALVRSRFMKGLGTGRGGSLDG
jgi:hypothetical protein